MSIVALALGIGAGWLQLSAAIDETSANAAADVKPSTGSATASGDIFVDSVVNALQAQNSLTTRLRLQVTMFGQQLYGPGRYVQQGRGPERKFRLDLSLQAHEGKHLLSHINDGERLWLYENTESEPGLAVVDVASVRRNLEAAAINSSQSAKASLLIGGLPRLLANLQQSLVFGDPELIKSGAGSLWRVHGTWQPDALASLIGGSAGSPEETSGSNPRRAVPRQLFTEVVLYVRQDSLFPARIEFLRQSDDEPAAGNTPRLLLAIELFDEKSNIAVDERDFARPADMPAKDLTAEFLGRLGVMAETSAN